MSAMILAAAVGPIPLAIARDYLSTYTPALIFFVATAICAGLLVLSAVRPVRNEPNQAV